MRAKSCWLRILATAVLMTVGRDASAGTVDEDLNALLAVGKYGEGYPNAQRAIVRLRSAGAAELPQVLSALDRASPLAANWIRNAFETIADREIREQGKLPTATLEDFVTNRSHGPQSRRLAYDWLLKVDASASKRLIPGMLLDPSSEFRRDAVAMRLEQAVKLDAAKDKSKLLALYQEALSGAVDDDQVKTISQALEKLGHKVNIAEHFAFLTRFSIIGPFDNRGGKGFAAVYPPEREQKLDAQYDGQLGRVAWTPLKTTSEWGLVDIAKQLKPYKGAAMYALAEFHSPERRSLEIRLGTPNAWKIWVNGHSLFSREEYHRGMSVDQYRVPVTMQPGRNMILLKVCQNEQTPDWAQRYEFQVRICNSSGVGIPSQDRLESAK